MSATSARASGPSAEARREARRESHRLRLAQAALVMFGARGYHDTSVDDIVARAQVSKSTFYEFYESKEHCFRELLAGEGGALLQAVMDAASRGEGHRDRMRRGISAFVEACFAQSALARVMLVESVGLSPSVEEVRHHLQGRFAHMVAEEIRLAVVEDPFYAGHDPEVFGRAVVGAVSDSVGYFLTNPGPDAESLADGLCRVFAP